MGERTENTVLNLVSRPDLMKKVLAAQDKQKQSHDQHGCRSREFVPGDSVQVRNYSKTNKSKLLPGTVLESTGPVSARDQVSDTQAVMRRHHHQLRASPNMPSTTERDEDLRQLQRLLKRKDLYLSINSPERLVMIPEPPPGQGTENRRRPVRDRQPPKFITNLRTKGVIDRLRM